MRTLIAYYSLEGNTDYAAKRMAAELGADTLRLVPKKAYADKGFAKFFWGGKSAVMAEKPELEPYEVNLEEYDCVILGFPVWASNFTPPLRSFLAVHKEDLKEKKLAAFACQSGGGAQKALAKLKKYIGIETFSAETILIDPRQKHSDETDARIDAFCRELNG